MKPEPTPRPLCEAGHRNFYEIVEKRDGILTPALPVLFERRIEAVAAARKLKKSGRNVKVRAVHGPRYRRR